jgi:phage portal protein BeeE
VATRTATDFGRDALVNSPDGWEVDEPWLWWLGGEEGDGQGGPSTTDGWGNPLPGGEAPPWMWNLPAAVTRCTSLIADTLAGMPWQVRRDRDRLDTPAWIADPQAKRRDARIYGGPVPQWRRSAVEFRAWSFKSMLWSNYGESMWYVPNRNDDGAPAPPIWQLNPDYVEVDGGEYVIPGDNPVALGLGDDRDLGRLASVEYRFTDDELIVIRGELTDGPRGIGVLQQHFRDLLLAGAIGDYAGGMLRRGVPNGYLKVSAPNMTKGEAVGLQRDWMRAHGGLRRRIAVLNATTDFHAIQLDPQAMELAKMREYSLLDIALMFGVNPYMLGITQDRSTYANVESRFIELGEFTLLKWARRMESGCDAELPRGTDMRINLASLLRADTLSRYQAHKIGIDAGFLLRDEARAFEDLPTIDAAQLAAEAAEYAAAAVHTAPERARVRGGGATPPAPEEAL